MFCVILRYFNIGHWATKYDFDQENAERRRVTRQCKTIVEIVSAL